MTDTQPTHEEWIGATVYDSTGDKVGKIDQIYLDDQSGQPEWLTVSTGWFGTAKQFVPIAGSRAHEDGLQVDATTDQIKDAPSIDDDGHLEQADERRLYDHYAIDYDAEDHEAAYGGRERADDGFEFQDSSADHSSGDTTTVTRSEEEVSVDKVEKESGRVRLRKYVVTEDVNITVPVRKQVARVVRTQASGDAAGTIDESDEGEEIVLSEEEIVVDKQVVAKENVSIETETVTEDRQVNEQVRKEQVEVDGDVDFTGN
ncbi:MAG: PRC and DUF2382 domain-containing protein [Ilumatobacteraceae bacterium]